MEEEWSYWISQFLDRIPSFKKNIIIVSYHLFIVINMFFFFLIYKLYGWDMDPNDNTLQKLLQVVVSCGSFAIPKWRQSK